MWRRLWCDVMTFLNKKNLQSEKTQGKKHTKKTRSLSESGKFTGCSRYGIFIQFIYVTSTVCMCAIHVGKYSSPLRSILVRDFWGKQTQPDKFVRRFFPTEKVGRIWSRWDPTSYTSWKVDGATPMYWFTWSLTNPPFGGWAIYFHYGV